MYVYTYTDAYNGILLNNKKNMRSSSFARTWVDLEGIRISEKKVKKINNFRISLICGI